MKRFELRFHKDTFITKSKTINAMFVKKTLLVYMVLEDTLMKHIKEKSRFIASFVTNNTHVLINLSNTIKHLTKKINHMNVKFVKSLLIMKLLLSST